MSVLVLTRQLDPTADLVVQELANRGVSGVVYKALSGSPFRENNCLQFGLTPTLSRLESTGAATMTASGMRLRRCPTTYELACSSYCAG